MKLVVGLGNPGERYRNHRHNVGFWVLDQVAGPNNASAWQRRFDGMLADCWIGAEKALLLKPQTYMNRSGRSVRQAVDFYKLPLESLLVVCDDLNLPTGKLRLRAQGSSGGQKGLKDIFDHLGTQEICRLRVGIGSPGGRDAVDHVLSAFSSGERDTIADAVIDAGRAVECWCVDGCQEAMNRFNGKQPTKE